MDHHLVFLSRAFPFAFFPSSMLPGIRSFILTHVSPNSRGLKLI